MKKYLVGGAVRDKLLNIKSNDNDYVIVGSTVEEMLELGFQQVGKDFPVFLHPLTNEEYALARTEIKTGNKHTDFKFKFSPDITLKDDLIRRDFTINAMALDEDNNVIDYFDGKKDLINKKIKAVRNETFIEDPLRVLRGARFAAQLDFNIDKDTMELFKYMVDNHMLEHLTPERIWKELEKALNGNYNTFKFFDVLNECGALRVIFPEIEKLIYVEENIKYHPEKTTYNHLRECFKNCIQYDCQKIVKFAILCHDLGKPIDYRNHVEAGIEVINKFCDRLKIPNEYRNFALLCCKYHMKFKYFNNMRISKQYDFVKTISNNFKDIKQLKNFFWVMYADFNGKSLTRDFDELVDFENSLQLIEKIYNVMKDVKLSDLSDSVKEKLNKFKGVKFGILYRDEMINYLRNHLYFENLIKTYKLY